MKLEYSKKIGIWFLIASISLVLAITLYVEITELLLLLWTQMP